MKKATQTQIDKARQFSAELMAAKVAHSLNRPFEPSYPSWVSLMEDYVSGERYSVELQWMVMAREVGIWYPPTEEQVRKGEELMNALLIDAMMGNQPEEDPLSQMWDVMKEEK